jgi:ketosteroid isomerase-like protein
MAIQRLSDVHAEFARRFNAGDVEGLLGWYEEGAKLVLPEGVRVGHDAIRDALTRLVESKGKMRMETVGVFEADGVAVAGATWRIEGENGTILAQGESVEVFRKGPDGWLAAVDCPFGVG